VDISGTEVTFSSRSPLLLVPFFIAMYGMPSNWIAIFLEVHYTIMHVTCNHLYLINVTMHFYRISSFPHLPH
jgi:hypothetical protein